MVDIGPTMPVCAANDEPMRSIAIITISTGAIGSSIGADLTHAGYNVCLVDQWPAHVEAMKANGLHVTMPDSELKTPVTAYHLCELSSAKKQFDIDRKSVV